MTGIIMCQVLITSIIYEMKSVLRDPTLSLYYKIVFCIFKIVCVCGFAFGREFPEKRNRAPLASPLTTNLFSSLETRHDEETTRLLPSDGAPEEVVSNNRPLEALTADTGFQGQELTVESVAALDLSEFRPTVVVVVPIYVRTLQQRREVMELIASLANQTYKAAQIILVDDCSPLPWYKISATGEPEEDLVKLPENTRLVRRPKNQGPASARTLGLRIGITEHQAQIVNFIDSDCEADSHWVEAMVEAHYHELKNEPGRFGEAILSGLTYAYGSSNVGKFHDHFGTLNGRIKKNGGGLLYGPSCNLSIRISKKLIYEVGGFDESFPKAAFEDVDFCLRANRCEILTQCAQNAKVWHKYGDSISQLFRMFQRYGASEWAVIENHPLYINMLEASYHIPSRAPKAVT